MYLEKVSTPEDLKRLSIKELKEYAAEARAFIIDAVKTNGGHLASNLGAVELTIALHYVFDSPSDKIVWDVGHQCYTHKLITGRADLLKNLRRNGGASGFPSYKESDHDHFTSGHSSNSLSLALGLRRAADIKGEDCRVIPVIGDGAFTGGMVYEALNDIGEEGARVIIVLNDNKMSISKNVGAMSKYFAKLRLSLKYNKIKLNVKKTLSALPLLGGSGIKSLEKIKNRFKGLLMANRLFENFGIMYYGPFDGHNIAEMTEVFKKAALKNKPVLIHLITQKGRGDEEAEACPDKFHGFSPAQTSTAQSMDYSKVLGDTLIELAQSDPAISAVTAAMPIGTGLEEFAQRYKERFFDVSIAEQHAVSLCAGLAGGGTKPFFAVYSTFLQRAFDQILHDVCINNLPVTFVLDRSGATGSDGVTHQGVFDLSYLGMIPNMTVLAPKDPLELRQMLIYAAGFGAPLAIRYPKCYNGPVFGEPSAIEYGKWERLKQTSSKAYILAAGCRAIALATETDANVINARFIKPLDTAMLDEINQSGNIIVTVEDNVKKGGFGEAVLSYCQSKGLKAQISILAHPDAFLDNRNQNDTFVQSGITAEAIKTAIGGK